jgi:hypothetical protein
LCWQVSIVQWPPDTWVKGQFVRSEAEVLDRLRLALFEESEVPVEEEPEVGPRQLDLFASAEGLEEKESEYEGEEGSD